MPNVYTINGPLGKLEECTAPQIGAAIVGWGIVVGTIVMLFTKPTKKKR